MSNVPKTTHILMLETGILQTFRVTGLPHNKSVWFIWRTFSPNFISIQFMKEHYNDKNNMNKMNSDTGSVPHPKW